MALAFSYYKKNFLYVCVLTVSSRIFCEVSMSLLSFNDKDPTIHSLVDMLKTTPLMGFVVETKIAVVFFPFSFGSLFNRLLIVLFFFFL